MIKNLIKISGLLSTAGLLMGNQSCQQQQVAPQRTLKKIVEMGSIKSPSVQLPAGGTFDFRFVANQQMYGVIAESEKFALRSSPPIIQDPSGLTDSKYFNVSTNDAKMVQKALNGKSSDVVFSRESWCMVNMPQAKLAGSVNSFEMVGGGGLSLGFGQSGPITTGLGVSGNFNVEYLQLDVSLRAEPPLKGPYTTQLGAVNVTADQTKTKVSIGIDLGMFSLGPSFYYQTPLAAVTKNAFTTALSDLSKQIKEDWYTRVMVDNDVEMILVGGRDVGLEVGDELLVYNENHGWSGEPCNSTYAGNTGTGSSSYYAKIVVSSVGDNLSEAKVVEISPTSPNGRAEVGAKVRLSRLHEEIPAEENKGTTTQSSATLASTTTVGSSKATRK